MTGYITEQVRDELLFRYGPDPVTGQEGLRGGHIVFRLVSRDADGVVRGQSLLPAMPIAVGATAGFDLGEIMSQVQIDAVARGDALAADLAAMTEARNDALAAAATLQDQVTQRDALLVKAAETNAARAAELQVVEAHLMNAEITVQALRQEIAQLKSAAA